MERKMQAGSVTLEQTSVKDAIQAEIARNNYVRAAMLAEMASHPQSEVRHLQALALKQVACEHRNAIATRKLAEEWGFSRRDLEDLLKKALEEHESTSDKIRSEQCYDASTGEYLTLRQWIEKLVSAMKGWNW